MAVNESGIFNLCVLVWVLASIWAIATGHIGSLSEAVTCTAIGSASFMLALVFSSFEAKWVLRSIPFLALLWFAR